MGLDAGWALARSGGDDGLDVSPYREVADNLHPGGRGGCDQIVEDRVDRGLMEDVSVPIAVDVELQGLELNNVVGRDICDSDDREIGETGARAQASELRAFVGDQVGSLGRWVRERFELVIEDLLLSVKRLSMVKHRGDSRTKEFEVGWSGSSLGP